MSDQDFFFDEEPQGTKSEGKSAKAAKQQASDTPAAPETISVTTSADDQSTTWAVASLLAVVGLLLGAILGFMLGTSLAKSASTPATVPAATAPAATVPSADPGTLTTDQVNSGLPAGHPPVSVPTSGSVDTTK